MKRDSKLFLFKFKFLHSTITTQKINRNVTDFFDNGIFECTECVKDPRSHGYCRPSRVLERVYSYLLTPPHSLPPAVPMATGYSESREKINDVSRMGTKGRHGAQGFGGMRINHIMGQNSTPGSVVLGRCDICRQLATNLLDGSLRDMCNCLLVAVFGSSSLPGGT